jgi:cell fate regulator YaaT (PSP1 superfamily)
LKVFRPKIKVPFFLYQVGARDWIRLDPRSEGCYGCCGEQILCCVQYKCPLPSVETELVNIENLSHRGLDKLRGRCNKLKCCLNYERDIYLEE